jgi:predicted site-specific integrase-resolvase
MTRTYTPEETARRLAVHRRTVYNYLRRGKIPGARKFNAIGEPSRTGDWRIPARWVEARLRHKGVPYAE